MSEENEIKIAEVRGVETYEIECPYCNILQATYYAPGELDTCLYCDREFEIGEFE